MISFAISGARIATPHGLIDDHAVIIADGLISAVMPVCTLPGDISHMSVDGGFIVPGFIDTQVNGGGGVLFNDEPTVDGLIAIAAAHRRFGTTALMPTLISDDAGTIAAAIAAVDAAINAHVPGIIGIHIEGPFLNTAKHGIHDARKFAVIDEDAIARLSSLTSGRTIVTLAPECAPPGAIAALVKRGVIVAAGHTLATYEQIECAIREGMTGITHLFNAMSPLDARAPGVVGAGFASDLMCGIIVDGHHVHPAALRAAFRARGASGLMLVTDAMPTVGSTAVDFMLGDQHITLEDGKLTSVAGTLAGSQLDMASAVRGAVKLMHVDLAEASQMASGTPAAFLGLSDTYGKIATGSRADLVHLDAAMAVQRVWIDGCSRL